MNRRPPSRNTSPNAVRKIALGTNTGARLTTSRRFRGARAVSGFRVPGDYFHTSANYVTQVGWTKLWGESLKLDYDPIVHVAAVKPKRGRPAKGETLPALVNAAREALKYAVKSSDMTTDRARSEEHTSELQSRQYLV